MSKPKRIKCKATFTGRMLTFRARLDVEHMLEAWERDHPGVGRTWLLNAALREKLISDYRNKRDPAYVPA